MAFTFSQIILQKLNMKSKIDLINKLKKYTQSIENIEKTLDRNARIVYNRYID